MLGSNGAIKQAARAGIGISLLSRPAVEEELSSGLLAEVRLKDPPATRPWFVLRSAVGPKREPVSAFIEFLRTKGQQMPSSRAGEAPGEGGD